MKNFKKKTIYLLIGISILCLPFAVSSQILSEQLGATSTNFVFTTNTNTLDVQKQIIIKRANYDYYDGSESGYGYGYQSFHLELISSNQIEEKKVEKRSIFKGPIYYEFRLYDKDNKEIAFIIPRHNNFIITNHNNTFQSYSFDLVKIPILLLERTHTIDIIKCIPTNKR